MKIKVGAKIVITDPTAEIKDLCRQLVVRNPNYDKAMIHGRTPFTRIPEYICLYEVVGNEIHIPFGCLQKVWDIHPQKFDWELLFAPNRRFQYKSDISLYGYQDRAVNEAIKAKNGILVMPCGTGKTQCGLEIISRVGGRALWLTHTGELLNQSKARAEDNFEDAGSGTITAGKVNIGQGITFATVQTMCKIDLEAHKNDWDIIIVDECHHCCGSPTKVTQFYKVLSGLSARYKIGLTATPKRADGLELSMYTLLGGVIHEVSREDEEVKSKICPIKVVPVETHWFPEYDCILTGDGTIDYSRLVDALTKDEQRFKQVSEFVNDLQNDKTIVLASRVEYLKRLQEQYPAKSVCLSTGGKGGKKDRKDALKKLDNGEINCIFATYQLAKEGLDVPSLQYVVFSTPEKDETTIIQSAGRVGRRTAGKEYGTVIDFVDGFPMYGTKYYKERKKWYKKIGAEVIE